MNDKTRFVKVWMPENRHGGWAHTTLTDEEITNYCQRGMKIVIFVAQAEWDQSFLQQIDQEDEPCA